MAESNIIDLRKRLKGNGDRSRGADVNGTVRRAVEPGEIHEVRELLKSCKKKADPALRIALSHNLGLLLTPLRGKPELTAALFAAGVAQEGESTKRLRRYAIFPGQLEVDAKSLSPWVNDRVKIAEAVAPDLSLTSDEAVLELVAGTELAPKARAELASLSWSDREVVNNLAGLTQMLVACCQRIIKLNDLDNYFRTIARFRLTSGNGGETFLTNDHPAATSPDEDEFWLGRLDLIPMVPILEFCDSKATDISATLQLSQETHAIEVTLSPWRSIAIGIAPFSLGRRAEGVLIDSPFLQMSGAMDGIVLPWNESSNERAIITSQGVVSGILTTPEPFAVERALGMASDAIGAEVLVRELSEISLFALLHQRPTDIGSADFLYYVENAWLTYQFEHPARAPAGTASGHLERHLLFTSVEDHSRLDHRLNHEAARLASAVHAVKGEIDKLISDRHSEFIRQQDI